MRAAKFAPDAWPERTPGEVMEATAFDQRGQVVTGSQVNIGQPRSWEELDCPDEIELELAASAELDTWWPESFRHALRQAGMSTDLSVLWVHALPGDPSGAALAVTKQAEDCWYAGVPRGRRLVLRRI